MGEDPESKSLYDLMKEAEEAQQNKTSNTTKSTSSSRSTSRVKIIKELIVPDFNDLIQFCLKNYKDENDEIVDIELEQFLKHTLPRGKHRDVFGFERGGGGWSGSVKCFVHIIHKMKEQGWTKER